MQIKIMFILLYINRRYTNLDLLIEILNYTIKKKIMLFLSGSVTKTVQVLQCSIQLLNILTRV